MVWAKIAVVVLALSLSTQSFSDEVANAGLDLEAHRGNVVVLDFWASWCVPCRRSFPWMNDMHAKYSAAGLVIIAVNLDKEPAEANRFLEKYPAEFLIEYDPGAAMAKRFNVAVMPSSFVIGRGGDVLAEHTGFKVQRQAEYEAIIREALTARSAP